MIDENCVKWLRLIFCRNLYPDVSRCPGLADAEGLAAQVSESQNPGGSRRHRRRVDHAVLRAVVTRPVARGRRFPYSVR